MRQSGLDKRLFYETGDLFDIGGGKADGLGVFIPCGLTAMSHSFDKFMRDKPVEVRVLVDFNRQMRIFPVAEVRGKVQDFFDRLYAYGRKSIRMNAIRTDLGARESEKAVIEAAAEWLMEHPEADIRITLVDLRGGFEKVAERELL